MSFLWSLQKWREFSWQNYGSDFEEAANLPGHHIVVRLL